jgi:hypothetical protein
MDVHEVLDPRMCSARQVGREGGERKLTPLLVRQSLQNRVAAYATTSFTSMLPRVALEYGQTMWAF